ncbi:Extracellular membrane CFEM domain protein [Rutstroemia sp. NJR-2017a BBW]|nr:Extracellular membrane CFEM domain protein [Rutstroemia sp. NJR-2017a BBW]
MRYLPFLIALVLMQWPVRAKENILVPICALHCWENTRHISKCRDSDDCLCREPEYQNSIFKCLYSQCDTAHFGSALHHSIAQCSGAVSDVTLLTIPDFPNHDSLRRREAEYLGGARLYGSGSDSSYPTQSAFPMQSAGPYVPGIFISSIPPLYTPHDTATVISKLSADPTSTVYSTAADLITASPLLFTGFAPKIAPCLFLSIVLLGLSGFYLAV